MTVMSRQVHPTGASILVGVLLLLACALRSQTLAHENTANTPPRLQLHVIPHSHIDHGWQLPAHEYQEAADQILRAVTWALLENPARTFVWAEVAFLADFLRREGNLTVATTTGEAAAFATGDC